MKKNVKKMKKEEVKDKREMKSPLVVNPRRSH